MSDFELQVMIIGNAVALTMGRIVGGLVLGNSILFLRGVSPLALRKLVFFFIYLAVMLIGIPMMMVPVFGVLGIGFSDPLPTWIATTKNGLPTFGTWLFIGLGTLWIIGVCWASFVQKRTLQAIEVWR